ASLGVAGHCPKPMQLDGLLEAVRGITEAGRSGSRTEPPCPPPGGVLTLALEVPDGRAGHRLGPAPYFRLDGGKLRAGPYDQGAWHVGQEVFIVCSTESPARVRFEGDGQATHGPFERVLLVDGAIWGGPKLLARYADRAWYSYPDDTEFPAAVLAPAGES